MEQHRDEHIDCADCGASFVFSADEAAVFVERGLAAPKRCKECRRARKERAANGAQASSAAGFFGQRAYANSAAAPRYGASQRRYTGDVNEYRSPMQDGFSGSPFGTARTAVLLQRSGQYRSPMPDGFLPRGPAPRAPRSPRPSFADSGSRGPSAGHDGHAKPRAVFDRPARDGNHRTDASVSGTGHERGYPRAPTTSPGAAAEGTADHEPRRKPRPSAESARRRMPTEMFAITCDTCGAQAEVPFKPAEGREVYCAACYRARRPSA